MPKIHPTAIVSPECVLGEDVEIGPYCIVSGKVTLGAGVRLIANVHINGPVEIGAATQLFPGACVGFPGQDYKFKLGDATAGVRIGANCILREGATVHAATKIENPTTVGDRVFMMAMSHVGHDSKVGNSVILVNSALVAGHAQVFDNATMSGNSALHQFNRIGRLAFIGGGCALSTDVPPFCIGVGRNRLVGINVVGMRRNGISRDHITQVRAAYREAFRSGLNRIDMLSSLEGLGRDCPPVMDKADIVRPAKRTVGTARRGRESAEVEDAGA